MLVKLIMFLCRIHYKRNQQPILYIKGTGKDYPRYLLYTEDQNVYQRMEDF